MLRLVVFLCLSAACLAAVCSDSNSCKSHLPTISRVSPLMADVIGNIIDARDQESNSRNVPWAERSLHDVDKTWCPDNSYYELIPVQMGSVPSSGASVSWSASCFTSTTASFKFDSTGNTGKVELDASGASTLVCDDIYIFTTAYRTLYLDVGTLNSNRSVQFPTFSNGEADDIKKNGVQAFILPCGVVGSVESALATVSTYINTDEAALEAANVDFLTRRKVFDRFDPFGKVQDVPASLIRSGDYVAVMKLDGLDPMIMWGTGGRTGHSAVAVWDGPQLYVCESTDKNPFGATYWPPPYGIIRTPYEQWVTQARNASFHVALLPLSKTNSANFDTNAFWSWFYTVQGMPYGYHNFMFTFLDTYPNKNLPQPVVDATYTWALTTLDRLLPNTTTGVSVYSLFIESLNKRLGTTCGSMACLVSILNSQSSSLGKLSAIPEDDNWIYDAGNYSMVCSVFAAHSWKVGMGSHWPSFEATEQTPKDNYQLNVFDSNYYTASNCPTGLVTTSSGSYCQIMGPYRLVLNGYNTIPIYTNVNNACPAQWPDYVRCPASNPQCC